MKQAHNTCYVAWHSKEMEKGASQHRRIAWVTFQRSGPRCCCSQRAGYMISTIHRIDTVNGDRRRSHLFRDRLLDGLVPTSRVSDIKQVRFALKYKNKNNAIKYKYEMGCATMAAGRSKSHGQRTGSGQKAPEYNNNFQIKMSSREGRTSRGS